MKYIVMISLFLLSTFSVQGQENTDEVTKQELLETKNVLFPEAEAVVLDEQINVLFDINNYDGNYVVGHEVKRKVKVYNSTSLDKVAFRVSYFVKGVYKEDAAIEEVLIYSLQGNEIVKRKLTNKDYTLNKEADDFREWTVTFKDIKAGSIIVYRYTKVSENLDVLPQWEIQGELPKIVSTYSLRVPEYFTYQMYQYGQNKIQSTEKEEDVRYGGSLLGGSKIKSLVKVMQVKEVAAFEEEAYMDNVLNYKDQVRFDLKTVKFPGMKEQEVLVNQKSFIEAFQKDKRFWKNIEEDKYYRKLLNVEELQLKNELDRSAELLAFVQDKVTWNGMYSIYPQEGVKTAFYKGTGNSADINMILVSMLRYTGIEANPLLVRTRSAGKQRDWQSVYFNTLLALIKVEGQYYTLDASSKQSSLGIIPIDNLNDEAVMIKENGVNVSLRLTPTILSNRQELYQLSLSAAGIISGGGVYTYDNYESIFIRERMNQAGEFFFKRGLEYTLGGARISALNFKKQTTASVNKTRIAFELSKANATFNFGNKQFINLFQFYDVKVNPFEALERKFPINFAYPNTYTYSVQLKLPEGYRVVELPSDKEWKNQENGLSFKLKYTDKKETVEAVLLVGKKTVEIAASQYSKVREMYQLLFEKLQEQVVIERID
ncbi:hypothetical protein VSO92_09785 [Myroides pelagicus]|uniref:hypothetical protein n=1 Tax=Myroides pelagicus TaxID=270914 RepID=UPI002DB9A6F4|nr:hypothetical protein [Myroides pelagicus]MEC4114397.1 hypothetical protein [Myroides pelagicus]